ncbi:hypothetical protein NKH71_32625 [Mesorhizobium sp. M0983]|uniref:hypothetical protein n=1 Tax=Mesorhizobium sp. M0983 TaxID=2957040 RepID=UPI003337FA49
MTTIAYKDGVMAADSRAFPGHSGYIGTKMKIRRLPDGRLIGASSGRAGACEAILDWYVAGADIKNTPHSVDRDDLHLLVVHPDGCAQIASHRWTLTGMLSNPYFAIGSGAKHAQAVLEFGGTPEQAVEVACKLDWGSGLPVVSLTHGTPSPSPKKRKRKRN